MVTVVTAAAGLALAGLDLAERIPTFQLDNCLSDEK